MFRGQTHTRGRTQWDVAAGPKFSCDLLALIFPLKLPIFRWILSRSDDDFNGSTPLFTRLNRSMYSHQIFRMIELRVRWWILSVDTDFTRLKGGVYPETKLLSHPRSQHSYSSSYTATKFGRLTNQDQAINLSRRSHSCSRLGASES